MDQSLPSRNPVLKLGIKRKKMCVFLYCKNHNHIIDIHLLVEEDNLEFVLPSGLAADYHSILKKFKE
jgi:hypothetical protein